MQPEFLAVSILILLFSVILHEVMHGLMAKKFGDRTAEMAGRLTLNPLPHIDPIGTILIPGFMIFSTLSGLNPGFIIGWAKPVPINPLNFRNIRRGELFVSAAGIGANFALAILASLVLHLLDSLPQTFPYILGAILVQIIRTNLLLGVFNLFPIPPLDGSKILLSQLSYKLAREYEKLENYGWVILLILLASGILQTILGLLVGTLTQILLF